MTEQELEAKEAKLKERLEHIARMEETVAEREKELKKKEKAKKQIILRLAPALWDEIAAWAAEDFRSINGQIEYLLSECVKKRKK